MDFLRCIMYYYNTKCEMCQVILVKIDKCRRKQKSFGQELQEDDKT